MDLLLCVFFCFVFFAHMRIACTHEHTPACVPLAINYPTPSTLNLMPFTLHRTHVHTHACGPVATYLLYAQFAKPNPLYPTPYTRWHALACAPLATYLPYTSYPEPKTLDPEPRNADTFV